MTSSKEEYDAYYKLWIARWSSLINIDRLDHLFPETLNECTAVKELEDWKYYTPRAIAEQAERDKNGCILFIAKVIGISIILALIYKGLGIH